MCEFNTFECISTWINNCDSIVMYLLRTNTLFNATKYRISCNCRRITLVQTLILHLMQVNVIYFHEFNSSPFIILLTCCVKCCSTEDQFHMRKIYTYPNNIRFDSRRNKQTSLQITLRIKFKLTAWISNNKPMCCCAFMKLKICSVC